VHRSVIEEVLCSEDWDWGETEVSLTARKRKVDAPGSPLL
jgi:uncharacterized protein YheU (UPF0270 family)